MSSSSLQQQQHQLPTCRHSTRKRRSACTKDSAHVNSDSSLTDLSSLSEDEHHIRIPVSTTSPPEPVKVLKPPFIRFKNLLRPDIGPNRPLFSSTYIDTQPSSKPTLSQRSDGDVIQFIDSYKRKVLAKVSQKHVNTRSRSCRPSRAGSKIDNKANNNDDYCSACDLPGSLVCCEKCPRAFHRLCLNPPLDYHQVPAGEWYCHKCALSMHWQSPPPPNPIHPTSPSLSFELPTLTTSPSASTSGHLYTSQPHVLPWVDYKSASSMLGAIAALSKQSSSTSIPFGLNGSISTEASHGLDALQLSGQNDAIETSLGIDLDGSTNPNQGRRSQRYSALVSRNQIQKILLKSNSQSSDHTGSHSKRSLTTVPMSSPKKRHCSSIQYTPALPYMSLAVSPPLSKPSSAIGKSIRSAFTRIITHTQQSNPRGFRLEEEAESAYCTHNNPPNQSRGILGSFPNLSWDYDGDLTIVTADAYPNSAAALVSGYTMPNTNTGQRVHSKKSNGPLAFMTCYACIEDLFKKPWMACHWCPMAFHLDCLPTPRTIMPPKRHKSGWKCPLHADIDAGLCSVERMRLFVETKSACRSLLL